MQTLANGLTNGLQLALLGVAFALVYRSSRILHLVLGGIYSLTPFIAYSLVTRGVSILAAGTVAVLAAAAVSLTCGVLNHLPLERRGAAESAHIVSSLGLMIVITQLTSLIWTDQIRAFPLHAVSGLELGPIRLGVPQAVSAVVSILALSAYGIWLHRTRSGLLLRAVAEDPVGVALTGRSVENLRAMAFALSGACTGLAAMLVAGETGFDVRRGLAAVVLAMTAMIIGGRGFGWGPVAGGLLLGLVREGVSALAGVRWQEPVTFALLAVFLWVRRDQLAGIELGTVKER